MASGPPDPVHADSSFSRRVALGAAIVGGWSLLASDWEAMAQTGSGSTAASADQPSGVYQLPPLPYGYADLEPHIDAETLKLHHDIHHAGYVRNANEALVELERIRQAGGDEYARIRAATETLMFNAAGHALHSIYWTNMTRDGGGNPPAGSAIGAMLTRDFGSPDRFREHFSWTAAGIMGSGWAVLAYEPLGQRLLVLAIEKHHQGGVSGCVPLLACDVWEHAYYLGYRNQRSAYLKAFMHLLNWADVDRRLTAALALKTPA